MSYEPEQPVTSTAAAKTNLPGIFLIVIGILGILGSLYNCFSGASAMMQSGQVSQDMRKGMDPEQRKQLEKLEEAGFSPEKLVKQFSIGFVFAGVLGIVAGVIMVLGGIKMRQLQSRGLAITGAVLAMIPCISPMSCPCLVGIGVGIWALTVLMNADVKAAFR